MGTLSKAFSFLIAGFFLRQAVAADIKVGSVVVNYDNLLEEHSPKEVIKMPNYRDEMRKNVITVSDYAKERKKDFIVITRQGSLLLNVGEWEEHLDEVKIAASRGVFGDDEIFIEKMFNADNIKGKDAGASVVPYSSAIDGIAVDYHECSGKVLTTEAEKEIKKRGIVKLNIRHCPNAESLDREIAKDKAADNASLIKTGFNEIPKKEPFLYSADNVSGLKEVKNFLLLTDYSRFDNKNNLIMALEDTNYDMLIVNPFFSKNDAFNYNDVHRLKYKKLGARRLAVASIDISRIGFNDFYFKDTYSFRNPEWIKYVDKADPDKYVVEYFNQDYRNIIGKYVKGIVDLGFDGIMLDGVDAHLIFEQAADID